MDWLRQHLGVLGLLAGRTVATRLAPAGFQISDEAIVGGGESFVFADIRHKAIGKRKCELTIIDLGDFKFAKPVPIEARRLLPVECCRCVDSRAKGRW